MTPRVTTRSLDALIRRVRLLVLDFDGVLTDNTVLVLQDGTEAVSCWRGDGLGLRAMRELGIDLIVLSTETNPVVASRCRKLGLACEQGCEDKPTALTALARARGVALRDVAYMGNDVNDLECLRMVGLPIVVRDAHASVRRAAKWRTTLAGGRGAVREVCDRIQERRGTSVPARRSRGR